MRYLQISLSGPLAETKEGTRGISKSLSSSNYRKQGPVRGKVAIHTALQAIFKQMRENGLVLFSKQGKRMTMGRNAVSPQHFSVGRSPRVDRPVSTGGHAIGAVHLCTTSGYGAESILGEQRHQLQGLSSQKATY